MPSSSRLSAKSASKRPKSRSSTSTSKRQTSNKSKLSTQHKRLSSKSKTKAKAKAKAKSRVSASKSKRKSSSYGFSTATDVASVLIVVGLVGSVVFRSTAISGGDPMSIGQSLGSEVESSFIRAAEDMPTARIVGGETAPKGRYSYPLALAVGGSFCGGSLINSDTVLTAAHCVTKTPGGACSVVKGVAIIGALNIMYPKGPYEAIRLRSCTVHPGYKRSPEGLVEFDVALVTLEKPSKYPAVWLDDGSKPLEMNDKLTVMGWGRTNQYSKGISPSLMRVGTKYMSEEKCNGITQGAVGATHMCCWAGSRVRESPYSGDSGGPLVVESLGDKRNQDIQVGIVSMVMGSLNPEFPAIYARVSYVAEWIKENTEGVKFASVTQAKNTPSDSVAGKIAAVGALAGLVGFLGGAGGQEVRYRLRDNQEDDKREVIGLPPPAQEELHERERKDEYEFAEGEI